MRRSTALTAAAAALLLLAASLAAAYMSIAAYVDEVETRRTFRDWMAKVNKTYDSIAEEEHRYAVFKENLRRFHKHGTPLDAAWAGLPNVFGDRTNEELSSMYPTAGCVDLTKEEPSSWNKGKGSGGGGRGEALSS